MKMRTVMHVVHGRPGFFWQSEWAPSIHGLAGASGLVGSSFIPLVRFGRDFLICSQ
jgi:hypothetical protein